MWNTKLIMSEREIIGLLLSFAARPLTELTRL